MAKLVKKENKNITILNNQVVNDKRLGWKALGIFVFLWHLPNNWIFHEDEIQTHSNRDGISSLRSGIKLLEKYKYLKIVRKRNELGQMIKNGAVWYLNDNPHNMKTGSVDNQHEANLHRGKRNLLNTDNTKHSNKQNTNVTNLPQQKAEKDFKKVDKFVRKHWIASVPSNKKWLIDRLTIHEGYKVVINAMTIAFDNGIGIMGMPNYIKKVVINNKHKPKHKSHNYYGHQPIKQQLPDWAKDDYHVKLHPTSKKQNEKVQRMLNKLNGHRKK